LVDAYPIFWVTATGKKRVILYIQYFNHFLNFLTLFFPFTVSGMFQFNMSGLLFKLIEFHAI